jgi:hypothetical protein
MKHELEKADDALNKFKAFVMDKRRQDHENKMQAFVQTKTVEIKQKIVDDSKAELRKVENVRKVKEADEMRKRKT